MRLGIGSPGHGQADQVHRSRNFAAVGLTAEHHGADFATADAADLVQAAGQRLPRIGQGLDMGKPFAGVDEHRMAAGRLDHGNTKRIQPFNDVFVGADAVAQIFFIDDFAQTLRDGVKVASGQAAVGWEALGLDQPGPGLSRQIIVVQGQPAADIGEAVLFCAHGHAVSAGETVAHDVGDRTVALARLPLFDEPGVLGEAAAVDDEGLAEIMCDLGHAMDIFQADRLPAAGIIGDGDHYAGHRLAMFGQVGLQPRQIHIALEGMQRRWILALVNDQIMGQRAAGLDIATRGIEMGVVRDIAPFTAHDRKLDRLRRAALMHRNNMLERHQVLDRGGEALE